MRCASVVDFFFHLFVPFVFEILFIVADVCACVGECNPYVMRRTVYHVSCVCECVCMRAARPNTHYPIHINERLDISDVCRMKNFRIVWIAACVDIADSDIVHKLIGIF